MGRGVTEQRLRQILERQDPPKYGAEYIPSTLATRDEAPSKSRPKRFRSLELEREIHVLSDPEAKAFILALYHPNVLEVHEQKMLSRWPAPHPLVSYPGHVTHNLPHFMGTVNVAERLDCLDLHPVISIRDKDNPGQKVTVAFPYQGDLLLFIFSDEAYCVNWNIKESAESFNSPSIKNSKNNAYLKRKAYMRALLEEVYYQDANIRTVRIAGDDIDDDLFRNLFRAWKCSEEEINVTEEMQAELLKSFIICIEVGTSPLEVALVYALNERCSVDDAKTVFFKLIWERKLRVNLFNPVLFDFPVEPEMIDVLTHYSEWFLR